MIDIQITIMGLDKLEATLRDPAVIQGPLRRFLERSAQVVEARAKERVPVDTGRLRTSISRRVEPHRRRAVVGSKLVYARPVEEGRRPGIWPPVDALQPWARRHGFPAGRAGAFLVARAISRRGIKAQPYLRPALAESVDDVGGFLEDMAREVETEFGRRFR